MTCRTSLENRPRTALLVALHGALVREAGRRGTVAPTAEVDFSAG